MDELLKSLNKYPNGTKLIIEWKKKLKLKGEIDTIYETDNGLEMDNKDYKEFYSCLIQVLDILSSSNKKNTIAIGSLMDITMQDPPSIITLETGEIIWKCN
jgi:hypothetical protein